MLKFLIKKKIVKDWIFFEILGQIFGKWKILVIEVTSLKLWTIFENKNLEILKNI